MAVPTARLTDVRAREEYGGTGVQGNGTREHAPPRLALCCGVLCLAVHCRYSTPLVHCKEFDGRLSSGYFSRVVSAVFGVVGFALLHFQSFENL